MGDDEKKLVITQHCQMRYAERIMGRDNKCDVAVFVNEHQEKIEDDINKMCKYGTLIYTGNLKGENEVSVFINGTWVLLTDTEVSKAITIYKIDFGLGDDFNKEFVLKMLEKIDSAKEAYQNTLNEVEEKKKTYISIITDLKDNANEHRKVANSLEKQADGYGIVLKTLDGSVVESEMLLREAVMEMVCKKEF